MLKGVIFKITPLQVIVDVNGVGYQAFISSYSFSTLPQSGDITLHIHTVVREDAFILYGFSKEKEKDLFTVLITVSGVGPKLALSLLSVGPEQLISALREDNLTVLTGISGVGKKTAKRLVLELKDKLEAFGSVDVPTAEGSHMAIHAEVTSALVNLGYDQRSAKKAVTLLKLDKGEYTLETAIKEALKLSLKS